MKFSSFSTAPIDIEISPPPRIPFPKTRQWSRKLGSLIDIRGSPNVEEITIRLVFYGKDELFAI